MVRLTITKNILEAIGYLDEVDRRSQGNEAPSTSPYKTPSLGDPITHTEVIDLSKRLREFTEKLDHHESFRIPPFHLDDLLRGSRVYVEPPPSKPEPSTEYRTLMARLRRDEEDKAYERMINPLPPVETFTQRFPGSQGAHLFPTSQADIGEDDDISYSEINRQMALIANVLISILACSVAIWMVAKYWPTPARLALSMGGSLIVGIAEVVVYAVYLGRLKEARAKGKKEVEIKKIIKTWVIGKDEDKQTVDEPISIIPSHPHDKALRHRKAIQTS